MWQQQKAQMAVALVLWRGQLAVVTVAEMCMCSICVWPNVCCGGIVGNHVQIVEAGPCRGGGGEVTVGLVLLLVKYGDTSIFYIENICRSPPVYPFPSSGSTCILQMFGDCAH